MRPYLAILSARFRMLLQYRSAAAAGFVTQLFWGLIRMMIFQAFMENSISPPLDSRQILGYIWLTQAFLLLAMVQGDGEIQAMIRTGNIGYELLRPVDLQCLWLSRKIATRLAPTLLRCVPLIGFAALMGWLDWPGLASALAGVAALAGAVLLSSCVCMLMDISMFWTVSGAGMNRLIGAITVFFSGQLIPLPLLPDAWQTTLAILPFRGLADAPFRLLLGQIPASHVVGVVAHQLIWAGLLSLLIRGLMARSLRRVVIQGG